MAKTKDNNNECFCNIDQAKEKMLSELYPKGLGQKAKFILPGDVLIVHWAGYIDALEDCVHYDPKIKDMRNILIKKMKELGWKKPE